MYLQDQMGTPLWGAGGSTRSLWNLHSNASFMYIYIYIYIYIHYIFHSDWPYLLDWLCIP